MKRRALREHWTMDGIAGLGAALAVGLPGEGT